MFAALLAAFAFQTPEQPDVVVVVADDLGKEALSLCPNIQSLQQQGTTFDRFYTYSTCSATRFALYAGKYPRRQETYITNGPANLTLLTDGIGDLIFNAHQPTHERLPLEVTFLPEVAHPEYFTTLIGKWHLGRPPLNGAMDVAQGAPFMQGFDRWLQGSPTITSAGPGATGYYGWNRVRNGRMVILNQFATHVQRDAFTSHWQFEREKPRLTFVCWSAPHDPFDEAPPGFSLQPTNRGNFESLTIDLDDAMGTLLAQVDLSEDYVFFISDNGTPDDARPPGSPTGFWKGSLYEGGINSPFIVAGPGVPQGVVSNRLTHVMDIGATVLEIMGKETPADFKDARSFADEIGRFDGDKPRDYVFVERYEVPPTQIAFPQPTSYDGMTVIEKNWKYISSIDDLNAPSQGLLWQRLYYLPSDPFEQNPIPLLGNELGLQLIVNTTMARINQHLSDLDPRGTP